MKPTVSRSHDPLRAAPLQDSYRHKSHVWIMGKWHVNLEVFWAFWETWSPMFRAQNRAIWSVISPCFCWCPEPSAPSYPGFSAAQALRGRPGVIRLGNPTKDMAGKVTPSGKHTKNYWKSPLLIGKSTITGPFSIAMLVYWRVNGGCSELL